MDKTVKYYMAPLESVTTWIYRQAHAKIYGRLDKYFIPFLEPHEKRDFKTRELQEILPEHNENIYAVPQILTNRSEGFIKLAKALKDWGYEEVNLNLGCPSKTVVTKGKGSGFLAKPEELERFLTEIFDALSGEVKISVKTRIGKEDPEEFPALLELFNKYPMEELIIHPRVQKDGYGNVPRLELYELAEKQSVNPLCYNGDLYTREQIRNFAERFPGTERLMFGRGFLRDPGLLYNEGKDSKDIFEKFWAFHDLVYEGYQERNMGDRNVLFKMKELWSYQVYQFSEPERLFKTFKKVQDCNEYEQMIRNLRR
ncbi:MAG: tRNA-dihydrouridine synthase family protein [Clostridiaceae bacterium]|nr:tRNA-dihydrouridine synthase family protein [Clostridiaceae bacterium]